MDDKHTILQLITGGEPEAADQIRTLVAGLDARQWRPVVAGVLPLRLRDWLAERRIPWVSVPIPQSFSPRGYLAAVRQLRRLVTAQGIALVHAHNLAATTVSVLARRSEGRRGGLPVVSTLHAAPDRSPSHAYQRWAQRTGVRWLLGRCDAVVVSSQRDRQSLAALAPRAGGQAQVVYPSLAQATPRPYEAGAKRRQVGLHQDAAIVGLVSRLEPRQGVESFLEAAALINTELPNVEFAVIGEGQGQAQLEDLAHELGLGGACVFLGQRRDIQQVIAALNIIVLLNDADRAPLRGLQALAAGLPVIAADTPELAEVFADLPGAHLVDVTQPTQLAAAIRDHILAPPEFHPPEVIIEGKRSITYRDFFVSRVAYDLAEPWMNVRPTDEEESPMSRAVRERYGPQRMVAGIESIYRQILEE